MDWIVSFLSGPIGNMLIVGVTPVLLAGAKYLADHLGKTVPVNYLPVIAGAVGAALDLLVGVQTIPGLPAPIAGAVLGLAGVGLRELVDQLRRKGVRPSAI